MIIYGWLSNETKTVVGKILILPKSHYIVTVPLYAQLLKPKRDWNPIVTVIELC